MFSEMDSSPRDGTPILAFWDNGCGWDCVVVWWSRYDKDYPWQADHNAYPEDKFDYWQTITYPVEGL